MKAECERCGAEFDTAKPPFYTDCPNCSEDDTWTCPECGAELEYGEEHCHYYE